MDRALIVVLFIAGVLISLYDRYGVQREYADQYARRHGHVAPLVDWFFVADSDPEVEYWRRRHRNMYLLVSALAVVIVILVLVRAPTWS